MGHMTFLLGKTLPYMNDLVKFLDLPKKKKTFDAEVAEFLSASQDE